MKFGIRNSSEDETFWETRVYVGGNSKIYLNFLEPYNCGNNVNHVFSENVVQVESHSHTEQATPAMS